MSEKESIGYGLRRIADALVFLGIAGLIGWDCQTDKAHRQQKELRNEHQSTNSQAHIEPSFHQPTNDSGIELRTLESANSTGNQHIITLEDKYNLGPHRISKSENLSLGPNTLDTNLYDIGFDVGSLRFSRRWFDAASWRAIYGYTSKEAKVRWGTNEIRIPADTDIDITFEGGAK